MTGLSRRWFLGGLGAALAAPAIIRIAPLMRISPIVPVRDLDAEFLDALRDYRSAFAQSGKLVPTKLIVPARLERMATKILMGVEEIRPPEVGIISEAQKNMVEKLVRANLQSHRDYSFPWVD